MSKYTVTEQIGKGATSVVYEGIIKNTNEKVAIKVIDSKDRRHLHLAANEIRVLQRLSHPNIIKIIETVETDRQTLIVLEKCKFSLSSVAKTGNLSYKSILRIFRDILVGIRYLHSNGIIHRDIKLGNVMISETNDLKIIDFGLSKDTFFSAPKTFCGTPDFISPEMMGRLPYTKKTDIYSAGMLIYFLIFRCDYSKTRMEMGKKSGEYGELVRVLEKMLEKDPSKRISAEEALSSSIFQGFFPKITRIDNGIKNFQINTKLGEIEYSNETIQMKTTKPEKIFSIKSGMGGIYEKVRGEEVYLPFYAVDTKTLKLVSFCYSILTLVKKRTPVVIILTDRGKFFKMLKDSVYVYIIDEYYVVWQDGIITGKSLKSKEKVPVETVEDEMKDLIYESNCVLQEDRTGKRPLTIDKRKVKGGSLYCSAYQPSGISLDSSNTLGSLARGRYSRKEYAPVFIRGGAIVRVAPYLYYLSLQMGEYYLLDVNSQEIIKYAEGRTGEVHRIGKQTEGEILEKVILFEDLLRM